jgi:flagellar basal-body rod protein FlgF
MRSFGMGSANNVSLSLATAMQRSLDLTANNMANATTAGYKATRPLFESVSADGSTDADAVNYVRDSGNYLDTSQGTMLPTGNPLDLAISGTGWFSYESDSGNVAYGRNGQLVVDANGRLSTLSGAAILDDGGSPITLPEEVGQNIAVAGDGTMTDLDGTLLGQIGVFRIPDPNQLTPIGNGMYLLPSGAPSAEVTSQSQVMQGYSEQSNVEPALEMIRLMDVQRTYERAVQVMNDANELTKQAIRRIARTV